MKMLKKLIKSDGDARYDVSFRRRNGDTSLKTALRFCQQCSQL